MKFCPHCGGDLVNFQRGVEAGTSTASGITTKPVVKYDQMATWRKLVEESNRCQGEPPDVSALAYGLADQLRKMFDRAHGEPVKSLIHLAVDRKIVPEGGALYMAAMSNGQAGPQNLEYFKARGYLVEDDHVRAIDDVPVGRAYGALDYWGGEKQFRRWHLSMPIRLNASRNGDPYFMDEGMICFGATWVDPDRLNEACLELLESLALGVKRDDVIAKPLAVLAVQLP